MSSGHVCPWWMGYLLASPLRRWGQSPHRILAPHVSAGMTVFEPGPGMGFFTLELARLVGANGRVIAADIQPKMLSTLGKRLKKAGLQERVELRTATKDNMAVGDLRGQVDFVLAFAVVHELPDAARFFAESFACLKAGGRMLLSEPSGHVKDTAWAATQQLAERAGFRRLDDLKIRRSRTVLLVRPE